MLQKYLGEQYHFELVENICDQFTWFINLLKKEEENPKEKYPCLDEEIKKYMTDREF